MRRLPFQPALEGLRGLAVLAVMLFHADVPGAGGGFLGVSTFFTLSGFLITGLLVAEREHEGRIHLGAFWGRRFRRLMPAALVGLALIGVLGGWLGDYWQTERLRLDGFAALFYVANWWLIVTGAAYADLMGSPSFVQHFWSLAIEEQYYAVFPLIAAALLVRGGRRPLAVALSLGALASWAWMFQMESAAVATPRLYYGTDTRSGELLVGGLLALALSGRPAVAEARAQTFSLLGVVGLAVSVFFWGVATVESPWLYQGGLALYGVASCAIVAGCVAPGGPVRALLSLRVLRFVGRVSYGAYVYHWPIFLVIDERTSLDPFSLFGLRVALTFAVAAASHRFIEEPILNRRGLPGWQSWVAAPVAFAAVALAFQQAKLGTALPEVPAEPVPLVEGAPRVAVLGDSVGDDIANGLEAWAARTGEAEILNLAIRGCGLATGAWSEQRAERPRICDRWRERARRLLRPYRPEVIVLATAVWELNVRELPEWGGARALGDPDFDAWISGQFEQAVRAFDPFRVPIVWLNAPCIRRIKGGQSDAYDPARVLHLNREILPAVAAANPEIAEVVDLYGAVCPGDRFSNRLYGIQPFRRDGIHFTEPAQHWIGEWLGPQIVEVAEGARD